MRWKTGSKRLKGRGVRRECAAEDNLKVWGHDEMTDSIVGAHSNSVGVVYRRAWLLDQSESMYNTKANQY